VGADRFAEICNVEEPPELTGLGEKLALTPLGKVEILNVTEVVDPFTSPTLTATLLLEPRLTDSDSDVGMLNGTFTVTVNVVLWARLLLVLSVPFTVT
jgi:hypothetical protein